jgi:hypothetical protein
LRHVGGARRPSDGPGVPASTRSSRR